MSPPIISVTFWAFDKFPKKCRIDAAVQNGHIKETTGIGGAKTYTL